MTPVDIWHPGVPREGGTHILHVWDMGTLFDSISVLLSHTINADMFHIYVKEGPVIYWLY